ncbi:hypothetical protein BGZ95_001282 [Linnemannia exigua]|uniref:Ferredoxin reductase-like protein n=1 Tax=Linnemannia exigua TaxID=604196 RepID=A0AAD4DL59_9FUNG|nr:hypothetical protein BGZ95_001282 [Linnemannia exigua]
MSNPAVAKWLEEIAAAKAKAQAREQQQQQQQSITPSSSIPQEQNPQQPAPQRTSTTTMTSCTSAATAAATPTQYGIIPSYNLRTHKKQLRLVLPPEPRKPGPGECCGNDCEPCVNTIYWEDLEAYREKCRIFQRQFEYECQALEAEESGCEKEAGAVADSRKESKDPKRSKKEEEEEEVLETEGQEEVEGTGLSIRLYRPFKVLRKEYLSENTLLVVCDLPYVSKKENHSTRTRMETMFHLLIRFQQPADGQFLTKAFTPVDLSKFHTREVEVAQGGSGCESSSSVGGALKYRTVKEVGHGVEDRMAFLVKLYPSPHATSNMFRALEVYMENSDNNSNTGEKDDSDRAKKGVLFLRGPIQTSRDRQRNQQQMGSDSSRSRKSAESTMTGSQKRYRRKRIVMIAAGSGITPMYQVLRALHDQQQHRQQHVSNRGGGEGGGGGVEEKGGSRLLSFWEADEVDLVYCNRTTDDIWLRQELQFFGSSDRKGEDTAASISEMTAGLSLAKRTVVRVQHVLSSPSSTHQAPIDQDMHRQNAHHRFHTGRITLDLLRNTLLPPSRHLQDVNDDRDDDDDDDNDEEQLQILVCGPPLFNKDVSAMLTELGYVDSASCELHILE